MMLALAITSRSKRMSNVVEVEQLTDDLLLFYDIAHNGDRLDLNSAVL